jgi:hypothetical protein
VGAPNVVTAPVGAPGRRGWHGLAGGLGVPGSAAGARAAYREGTEKGEVEWGSLRRRHGGEAEKRLRVAAFSCEVVLLWSSSAGEVTYTTGDEGGGERRSHRGQGWPECRAHRGSGNGGGGGYQSGGCCGSPTAGGG